MCGALWEVIKCPGKVVCCCCKCACNMLFSFICSVLVLAIVIGLIIYFTVYYHKNGHGGHEQTHQKLLQQVPTDFRDCVSAVLQPILCLIVFILILVGIGLILYFTLFYDNESDKSKAERFLSELPRFSDGLDI